MLKHTTPIPISLVQGEFSITPTIPADIKSQNIIKMHSQNSDCTCCHINHDSTFVIQCHCHGPLFLTTIQVIVHLQGSTCPCLLGYSHFCFVVCSWDAINDEAESEKRQESMTDTATTEERPPPPLPFYSFFVLFVSSFSLLLFGCCWLPSIDTCQWWRVQLLFVLLYQYMVIGGEHILALVVGWHDPVQQVCPPHIGCIIIKPLPSPSFISLISPS